MRELALLLAAAACGAGTVAEDKHSGDAGEVSATRPDADELLADGGRLAPDASDAAPDASTAGDAGGAGTDAGAPPDAGVLSGPLAAFPGCQGAGCYTRAGFDGAQGTPAVYRVTSLGGGTTAGTLGACIAAAGPRVCTFAVAGTIHAPSPGGYQVLNPYLTIRGDTAPGMGIAIDNDGITTIQNVLTVKAHDVVLRGLRFRNGLEYTTDGSDALSVVYNSARPVNDIVVDHVSMHWGSDEVFSVSAGGAVTANNPHDITVSYSVIGEGLGNYSTNVGYSKCALVAGYSDSNPDAPDAMTDIDFHHVYFANCARRNPEMRVASGRLVNNILYNWGQDRQSFQDGMSGDLIGNMGRHGPNTSHYSAPQMFWVGYFTGIGATGPQSVHLSGNKYFGDPAPLGWGTRIVSESKDPAGSYPEHRLDAMAPAASGPPIVAEPVDALPASVLGPGGAGHSRRLDCGGAWVSTGVRDVVDERLIADFSSPPAYYPNATCYANNCWPRTVADTPTGRYPTIEEVPSTAVCAAGARDNTRCACLDTDVDGMPDYWERARCGAASGAGSCAAFDTTLAAPWTDLEAFQSGLLPAP